MFFINKDYLYMFFVMYERKFKKQNVLHSAIGFMSFPKLNMLSFKNEIASDSDYSKNNQ